MNNEILFIIEEPAEGGFTARALQHSIFTEAETINELKENIKEAVNCHFEPDKLPKIIHLHYTKEEFLAV